MRLNTLVAPIFKLPVQQESVLRLGLAPLDDESRWLIVDEDWEQFFRHKSSLKSNVPEKIYVTDEFASAAVRELNQRVVEHLKSHAINEFDFVDNEIVHRRSAIEINNDPSSLWITSLLVQDDLCILQKKGDDYVLTAASVCSPSNWRLEEKFLKSLDIIHQPVPGYQEQLASRVNRFFESLSPRKVFQRYNWSLQVGNELGWRDDGALVNLGESNSDKAFESLFWRVERQVLTRLPKSEAIVFSIRIFLHPLQTMITSEQQLTDFIVMLQGLPDTEKRYKNINQCVEYLNKMRVGCVHGQ